MRTFAKIMLITVALIFALPMTASMSQALKTADMKTMVSGQTWKIMFQVSSRQASYWNWKRDGTVCARIPGASKENACSDDGHWRLDGKYLCWDLTWFAGQFGIKNQCVTARRTSNRGFEAQSKQFPDAKFFNFTVVK